MTGGLAFLCVSCGSSGLRAMCFQLVSGRLMCPQDVATHARQVSRDEAAFVAAPAPPMVDRQRPSMLRQLDEDGQLRVAQEARIDHTLGYRAPSALGDRRFSLAHVRLAVIGPMRVLGAHCAWAVASGRSLLDAHSSSTIAMHGCSRATNVTLRTRCSQVLNCMDRSPADRAMMATTMIGRKGLAFPSSAP